MEMNVSINPLKGNPLRAAVERNHTEAALLLLQRGAQVNVPIGHHGSLLQGAVFNKQLEMVRLLLAWGATVNEDLSKYGPPLEIASYRTDGNEDMLLLEYEVIWGI
jgi:ankyrin repeat protein